MKILVVGGGGREHALVWKIAQSPLVKKIYCAPGNPGIAQHAECVPLRPEDILGILQFVREKSIDLTVVGPEDPLTMGIADKLTEKGFPVFGPTAACAEIEGSKVFCRNFSTRPASPRARSACSRMRMTRTITWTPSARRSSSRPTAWRRARA